ncbi:MAG: GGDEF domain-containing response regulator [Planctomycetota bacterium]|jgi:diguanylate cyclase (GGDEF)-like protein
MTAVNSGTILLVSGDAVTAAARTAQLEQAGWRVVRAADGIEVLSLARTGSVDLVILHIPVDDMLDTGMADVLHRVSSDAYLPVMVLADSARDGQRCGSLDSKADDVISCETSAAEMTARVRALLRIRDLYRQLETSRAALQQALARERRLLGKLRRDNEQLQVMCTTDPLTHVQNVRSFRDILDHEFSVAKRYNQPISMLVLDLDHFKVVNDTHGHPAGDYVLKELAVILKNSVRESDVVARTGGEEFSLILPKAGPDQAAGFAERIRTEVSRRKFIVYGDEIHVTTSTGSASFPADAHITIAQMLVYFADQALLEAKEAGRDRVVSFGGLPEQVRVRIWRQYASTPIAVKIEGEGSAEREQALQVR